MRKVLYVTNIPAPYKINFLNLFGKNTDLTVIFEAKNASDQGIKFNYNIEEIKYFKAIFLSDGNIREKHIDWSIFRFIRAENYDDIILTNYSYLTEMTVLLYLKFRKIPYYFATDGGIIKKNEGFIKHTFKRMLLKNSKGYFSPSKSSDDYLVYYGADREKINRYPFTSMYESDLCLYSPSFEEKLMLRDQLGMREKYIVLGVGQFIYRKGWDVLLKAVTAIDKDVGVYLVGGQPSKEYLDIVEKNNLGNVHFLNFMSDELLSKYYLSSDLFVLPTREDIWGLVINEAMAYGLPVITTTACVAGIEMVKDGKNGFLVSPDDSIGLVQYIKIILYNDKYSDMQQECLKTAKKYTLENMADAFLRVIN